MGTMLDGFHGTVPEPITRASTGSVPAAIGAAVHGRRSLILSRRADVAEATTNMAATYTSVHAMDPKTTTSRAETTASCRPARTAAVTIARPSGRPATDTA